MTIHEDAPARSGASITHPTDPAVKAGADHGTPAGPRRGSTDPEAAPLRGPLQRHGLLTYVLLAFGISWSLLVTGYLTTEAGVLDPDGALIWWVAQLAAAGPAIAAVIVVAISRGRPGLAALGRSLVRWRVNPAWYAVAFLGIPLVMLAAVAVIFTTDVVPAGADDWSVLYLTLPVNILGLIIFTGLAEEPGWRGYAQPAANHRYPPLTAALVVSVLWGLWHLPNALFGQTVGETGTHLVATVANGFLLAWAYNATGGSVLIVMLLHAATNATFGVVQTLTEGSADAPSTSQYYLLSAAVFAVLMTVVALRTRGRLGLPADPPSHLDTSKELS